MDLGPLNLAASEESSNPKSAEVTEVVHQVEEQQSVEKENVKQILPQVAKIKYPMCQKGNFHQGELLNYVCLNTTNKDDLLGCAVCQEESKKASWRPLKVVLNSALENSIKQAKNEFNCDEITSYLEQQQLQAEKEFERLQESLLEKLAQIKQSILGFFHKMKDQALSHSSTNSVINNLFNSVYDFNDDLELLKTSVLRLINYLPEEQGEDDCFDSSFDQKAIQQNIQVQYQEIQKAFEKGNQDLESLLELQRKTVSDLVLSANISGKSNVKFYFSPSLKHSQISVLSKTVAKCQGSAASYRFAILEPALLKSRTSKFAFKFKQGSGNNWIAVGVCHKNIVVSKNFGFQFSSLGHGAYMISSNGGTWSTNQVTFNNAVKTFSFGKNDVIAIEFDPVNKYVKFTKEKQPEHTYKLDITHIENDTLHPCVLFYFVNDEVEYIHNYSNDTPQ